MAASQIPRGDGKNCEVKTTLNKAVVFIDETVNEHSYSAAYNN